MIQPVPNPSPFLETDRLLPQSRSALPLGERLTRREGVCGGVLCISGTRIPVWVLEQCRRLNQSLEQILEDFPFLRSADVTAAWDYADAHLDEVSRQIQENEGR